jgi:hypothetical protein
VADHWHGGNLDRRWRLWTLVGLARQRAGFPQDSPANFAEFGVYRGGCTFVILATTELAPEQRYYLFDTFEGVPADGRLSETELERGLAGHLADTSTKEVLELLSPWRSRLELCEGNVFDTLEQVETGPLSLVHMDLNGAAATERALEYAYPRLVPGAIIVLDDYGLLKYDGQRRAVDGFFAEKPEQVVALPTAQGLLIKQ